MAAILRLFSILQGEKMKKVKKVKGFVMNKRTGHASYAFQQQDVMVHSLGFTHNKDDFADKEKLKHNIDPLDGSNCYVKTKIEKQKYNTYRSKPEYSRYRIHDDDKDKIQKLICRHKKRR